MVTSLDAHAVNAFAGVGVAVVTGTPNGTVPVTVYCPMLA